jgi:class 3 adenylate cyclase
MNISDEEGLFNSIRCNSGQTSERSRFEADVWGKFGCRCAMLVLDSSGFTRNTQEYGILSYLACIVRLRDMMDPILTRFDCISWRVATDNVFAEFETANGALAAALEIQRSVSAANIQVQDSGKFGVCIGIGFGDVLRSRSEGVFGNEMNLASKLGEDLAGNGEILLTESAYQEISEEYRRDIIARRTNISGVELSYYIIRGVGI